MSQLTALTKLFVGGNKLPSTEVEFIIESFPQLTELGINDLGLAGERLRSTNRASYPSRACACSAAVHDRQFEGARDAPSRAQQLERYVPTHVVPAIS